MPEGGAWDPKGAQLPHHARKRAYRGGRIEIVGRGRSGEGEAIMKKKAGIPCGKPAEAKRSNECRGEHIKGDRFSQLERSRAMPIGRGVVDSFEKKSFLMLIPPSSKNIERQPGAWDTTSIEGERRRKISERLCMPKAAPAIRGA